MSESVFFSLAAVVMGARTVSLSLIKSRTCKTKNLIKVVEIIMKQCRGHFIGTPCIYMCMYVCIGKS